jgi:hypothetical protein
MEGCAKLKDFNATALYKALSYLYAIDYDDTTTLVDTAVVDTVMHIRSTSWLTSSICMVWGSPPYQGLIDRFKTIFHQSVAVTAYKRLSRTHG